MKNYNRGDVYYVEPNYSVGSEQRAGRPAVIVSNNKNNEHSTTVEIVYFTTKDKRYLPTHVTVNATGVPSTALCEQVHTVDKQRLGNFCGTCTKQEMTQIDIALAVSLDLVIEDKVQKAVDENVSEKLNKTGPAMILEVPETSPFEELTTMKAKYELLETMYHDLLVRVLGTL